MLQQHIKNMSGATPVAPMMLYSCGSSRFGSPALHIFAAARRKPKPFATGEQSCKLLLPWIRHEEEALHKLTLGMEFTPSGIPQSLNLEALLVRSLPYFAPAT